MEIGIKYSIIELELLRHNALPFKIGSCQSWGHVDNTVINNNQKYFYHINDHLKSALRVSCCKDPFFKMLCGSMIKRHIMGGNILLFIFARVFFRPHILKFEPCFFPQRKRRLGSGFFVVEHDFVSTITTAYWRFKPCLKLWNI